MSSSTAVPLRRALLSVSDKTGLLELASFLRAQDTELVSTGGTAHFLRENGFSVRDVSELTRFPEILDGRVKTLHPSIHAALLARRDLPEHLKTLEEHHIAPIDLVVVNLYPFEKVAQKPEVDLSLLIENIDIGGPSMLRSAAKNHASVSILCDPSDYPSFIAHVQTHKGTTYVYRQTLALKVFATTSHYDSAISQTLSNRFGQGPALRYGENPHQHARVTPNPLDEIALASVLPLQGKALSYNNLLDADAAIFALRCLTDNQLEEKPTALIIKHCTPCGAAHGTSLEQAIQRAIASDPLSAFGGIAALSDSVDEKAAHALSALFLEVIVAPHFSALARELFGRKKDLRLLELPNLISAALPKQSSRSIYGGVLYQSYDQPIRDFRRSTIATHRSPSEAEWRDLEFAFRTSIPCKSNAITLAKDQQLLAAGAGQTSRVDAVTLAISKAGTLGHRLEDCVLGSDAFFPFADAIEAAAKAGVKAIAQPGGSKRDNEVIAAANAHNIAMVFTHERHFRH